MKAIEFSVSGQPQGKARARVTAFGGFARAYTPKQTVIYENSIRSFYAAKYGAEVAFAGDVPLKMHVTAVFEIPKSFSSRKRLSASQGFLRPLVKPDGDNILKVVSDALNKVAYSDDKQIVDFRITKIYGEHPRLEIQIKSLWEDLCDQYF